MMTHWEWDRNNFLGAFTKKSGQIIFLTPCFSRAILSWRVSQTTRRCGYGSIPIDTFLVGWTSIYQLFWCSPGVFQVLTHCHVFIGMCMNQKSASAEWLQKFSRIFIQSTGYWPMYWPIANGWAGLHIWYCNMCIYVLHLWWTYRTNDCRCDSEPIN